METLSGSVSTLKVPNLHSRESSLFKNTATSQLPPPSHRRSTTRRNSISNRPTSFSHKTSASLFTSACPTSHPSPPSPPVHQKPATGYAAALLDIASCNNSLYAVERDVRRFLKFLRNEQLRALMADPAIDGKEKGMVVKEIAEKGRFHGHVVSLLRMLINKNKVEMVREVLEEFGRIYEELSGTRVVLVSSRGRLQEDELLGIAKRVQRLSGAAKVKVKHLIDESFPVSAFAT